MRKKQPKIAFAAKPMPDGTVDVHFLKNGKPYASSRMDPSGVANALATITLAAMAADRMSGKTPVIKPGASLAGVPAIAPTGIGLSSGRPPEPLALILHLGQTKFGVVIKHPTELARALLAASVNEGQRP